jgi:hypothetical protein
LPLENQTDPAILGFYKMMQSGEAREKISNIELVDLTPEDAKKAATPMDSPTGGKVCLTLNRPKSSSSRWRKRTPTAAQPAQAKTSLPRKTASLLFLYRGRVSNSSGGGHKKGNAVAAVQCAVPI